MRSAAVSRAMQRMGDPKLSPHHLAVADWFMDMQRKENRPASSGVELALAVLAAAGFL